MTKNLGSQAVLPALLLRADLTMMPSCTQAYPPAERAGTVDLASPVRVALHSFETNVGCGALTSAVRPASLPRAALRDQRQRLVRAGARAAFAASATCRRQD
jgi:hypothetical protein